VSEIVDAQIWPVQDSSKVLPVDGPTDVRHLQASPLGTGEHEIVAAFALDLFGYRGQERSWQGDGSLLVTLGALFDQLTIASRGEAPPDVDHSSREVDVGHAKSASLARPHTGEHECREVRAVGTVLHSSEKRPDLIRRQRSRPETPSSVFARPTNQSCRVPADHAEPDSTIEKPTEHGKSVVARRSRSAPLSDCLIDVAGRDRLKPAMPEPRLHSASPSNVDRRSSS